MYETTVGDSNPVKKLCVHVPSPYDIHVINKQIYLYGRFLDSMSDNPDYNTQGESETDKEFIARKTKFRRMVKADVTKMKHWIKQQSKPDNANW